MNSNTHSSHRLQLTALFSLACWCGILGSLLMSLLGLSAFIAPDFWFTDNMSFFIRQFLTAGLTGVVLGALGLLKRHHLARLYRTLLAMALTAFVALAGLTFYRTLDNTVSTTPAPAQTQPLKVLSINIEYLFLADEYFRSYIERENPDVLVMQEVIWGFQEHRWKRLGLEDGAPDLKGFPQYRKVGELGGLVVYSRLPVTSMESIILSGATVPGASVYYDADRELLSFELETETGPLNLLAIHPDSPRNEARWRSKRGYFQQIDTSLAELVAKGQGRILAIGDWNTAPWSTHFQRLLAKHGLKTAYPGGWPQTTRFFFDYRLHWILGAPVDQFAVSDDITITNVSLGPHIGSDHLPLVVELVLPPADGQ